MPDATPIGLLGTKLPEALQRLGLFTWFSFVQFEESSLPDGGKLIFFRPSGSAFRQLVKLRLTVNAEEVITSASLHIDRAFIDDPSKCVFAADLATSFVSYAPTFAGNYDLNNLVTEIGARARGESSSPILTAQSLPSAPPQSSATYQVYAGKSGKRTLQGVTLENGTEEGKPVLAIHLVSQPPPGLLNRILSKFSGR